MLYPDSEHRTVSLYRLGCAYQYHGNNWILHPDYGIITVGKQLVTEYPINMIGSLSELESDMPINIRIHRGLECIKL